MSDSRSTGSHSLLPRALFRFVELFNREEFWEGHEVLEEPWRKGRSEFYHGLILYASAFVHVQRNNPRGVVAQLGKAERSLTRYAPNYLGIDVARVLEEAGASRAEVSGALKGGSDEWSARVDFPKLALDPSRVRGDEPELALE